MYNDGVQRVYLNQARIICAGKNNLDRLWRMLAVLGKFGAPFQDNWAVLGRFGAPFQDNWAVLGRFGAPSRQLGSTWKVWRPKQGNFPWSLVAKWLQTREFPLKFRCKRLAKNFKYHFCPPLVFISIKSLFEDVPLWMMENNLDKLRSIEDKLNKVFIFYLQPYCFGTYL